MKKSQPPERVFFKGLENRSNFIMNLREKFGTNPFTRKEYEQYRPGLIPGTVNKAEVLNELCEDGTVKYFTKNGIRYYQFKE